MLFTYESELAVDMTDLWRKLFTQQTYLPTALVQMPWVPVIIKPAVAAGPAGDSVLLGLGSRGQRERRLSIDFVGGLKAKALRPSVMETSYQVVICKEDTKGGWGVAGSARCVSVSLSVVQITDHEEEVSK